MLVIVQAVVAKNGCRERCGAVSHVTVSIVAHAPLIMVEDAPIAAVMIGSRCNGFMSKKASSLCEDAFFVSVAEHMEGE